MEQRIERRTPQPWGRKRKIGLVALDLLAHGGMSTIGEVPTEELEQIEQRGFNLEEVQEHIDSLSRSTDIYDQKKAAMLRGAFNDLLARIPDSPQTEHPQEIEPAA